jgi:hypothetical protein
MVSGKLERTRVINFPQCFFHLLQVFNAVGGKEDKVIDTVSFVSTSNEWTYFAAAFNCLR